MQVDKEVQGEQAVEVLSQHLVALVVVLEQWQYHSILDDLTSICPTVTLCGWEGKEEEEEVEVVLDPQLHKELVVVVLAQGPTSSLWVPRALTGGPHRHQE